MDSESDDDLMRLAGCGDCNAFSRLVHRHVGRASRIAGRIVGRSGDAEEIVQEACLRAWLKAPDWRANDASTDGALFATWFCRVVVNLCLDRRRRVRPIALDQAAEIADPTPDGLERVAEGETTQRVAAAIANLPERQRVALTLCYFEEMSNIEAASVLKLSVGAVESLLVRARRTLRTALADLAHSLDEGHRS